MLSQARRERRIMWKDKILSSLVTKEGYSGKYLISNTKVWQILKLHVRENIWWNNKPYWRGVSYQESTIENESFKVG